eukprot:m.61955 g.61955  ORF g.61955 m.61955 type:complete len:63 (+) comp11469_c0_seq1:2734-2922(+)
MRLLCAPKLETLGAGAGSGAPYLAAGFEYFGACPATERAEDEELDRTGGVFFAGAAFFLELA